MESIKEKTARILKGLEQIKVIMRETRHDLEKINNIESRLKDLENTASALHKSIGAANKTLSGYSSLNIEQIASAINSWYENYGPGDGLEEDLLWLMCLITVNSDEINKLSSRVKSLEQWSQLAKADSLSSIGYNDTEIAQCIEDVPDLTPQDITQAKAVADAWDASRTTLGIDILANNSLRILPKLDMSNITTMNGSFRNIPELRYCPTLNLPSATSIGYIWMGLRKLRRIPVINAPELVRSEALYSALEKTIKILPPVIRHPKLTTAVNMFHSVAAEAFMNMPDLELDWSIITDAHQMFDSSGIDRILTFDMPVVKNIQNMYRNCAGINGDYSTASWNIPENTSLRGLFSGCSGMNAVSVDGLCTANVTDIANLFSNTRIKSLEIKDWDSSNVSDARNVVGDSSVEEITWHDLRLASGCMVTQMFAYARNLRTLRLLNADFSDVDGFGLSMFFRDHTLENISGSIHGIDFDLSLEDCTRLTTQSALVIIDGLAQTTNRRRLTLPSMAYDGLTPEQIAVATSKGWTVVRS